MMDFEKLGLFYLGRREEAGAAAGSGEPVLYDSRDLVTHGVAVGMTGSGKTGLCVTIIEEALEYPPMRDGLQSLRQSAAHGVRTNDHMTLRDRTT